MIHIITTVGTSLMSNAVNKKSTELDDNTFNISDFENQNTNIQKTIYKYKVELKEYIQRKQNKSCAEISSICKIDSKEKSFIHLICTETISSYLCGIVLKEHFGNRAKLYYVNGLQVVDANVFQNTGFFNLVEIIKSICDGITDIKVFNISGGYKAIIPVMTILAQLEKASIYYTFEDSEDLIEIANLPINFDWEIIERHVQLLHNDNKRKNSSLEIREELVDLRLMKPEGNELTVIGQLISKYSNRESPFTRTIFGYFMEYKFHETLSKKYGAAKVEHSVKVIGMNSSDIDILITPDFGKFIAIEIKPINILQYSYKMKDVGVKMSERIKGLLSERKGKIDEIWLMVYTLGGKIKENLLLDDVAKENIDQLIEMIKNEFNYPVVFRVKHYMVQANKLNQEDFIYKKFMKSPLKYDEIQELFSNETKN